jgi:hypothetical protein
MLKSISKFVFSPMSLSLLAAFVLFSSGVVHAADIEIPLDGMPGFTQALTTLKTTIGTIIVSALAIGLMVWAARYLFHVVKSMGR